MAKLLLTVITTQTFQVYLFGDVTDQKNKQIIISMGAGANAALNALIISLETNNLLGYFRSLFTHIYPY